MANQTDKNALRVRGTDPQFLIEKLTRERIYSSRFWREHCFGVSVEDLVVLAANLTHVGGLYGHARTPTPFVCLLLKLLQLGPERDVLAEFFAQSHFKYAVVLAACYLRIVGDAVDIYVSLEPLFEDYRKMVMRRDSSLFELTTVDAIIETLLCADEVFGLKLPRIQRRHICEELGLAPRVSPLGNVILG
jgi:pre-mRNA-splicing factor 38A